MSECRQSENICGAALKNWGSKALNKNKLTNLNFENEHLSEEQLLMFVDGELSSKQVSKVREHLETCWTCRAELEKVEETISLFVEFRKKVQTPLNPPPPNNWSNFTRKLNDLKREETKPQRSWFSFSNFSPF
jgi:anti-sigma factor RsiW